MTALDVSEPQRSSRRRERFARVLVWASVIAPLVCYVFGRAYVEAWTRAHGLPVSAFNVSVEDALFGAYVGLAQGVVFMFSRVLPEGSALVVYFTFAFLLVLSILVVWARVSAVLLSWAAGLWQRALEGAVKWVSQSTREKLRKAIPHVTTAYMVASFPIFVVGVVLYLVLLALVPALAGDHVGQREGTAALSGARKAVASGEFGEDRQIATLTNSGSSELWLVVMCGDRGCGLVSQGGVRFVPWEGIESISPP